MFSYTQQSHLRHNKRLILVPENNVAELLDRVKLYSLRLDKALFSSLDLHISALKSSSKSNISKRSWINQAIEERLEKELSSDAEMEYKQVCVTLKIPNKLEEKIDSVLNRARLVSSGISKKQWIEKAIREKLDQESSIREQALGKLSS